MEPGHPRPLPCRKLPRPLHLPCERSASSPGGPVGTVPRRTPSVPPARIIGLTVRPRPASLFPRCPFFLRHASPPQFPPGHGLGRKEPAVNGLNARHPGRVHRAGPRQYPRAQRGVRFFRRQLPQRLLPPARTSVEPRAVPSSRRYRRSNGNPRPPIRVQRGIDGPPRARQRVYAAERSGPGLSRADPAARAAWTGLASSVAIHILPSVLPERYPPRKRRSLQPNRGPSPRVESRRAYKQRHGWGRLCNRLGRGQRPPSLEASGTPTRRCHARCGPYVPLVLAP